jgi:VWFA-related protein
MLFAQSTIRPPQQVQNPPANGSAPSTPLPPQKQTPLPPQQTPNPPQQSGSAGAPLADADEASFVTTVQEVVAYVTVKNHENQFVNNIRPDQFRLFDNDNEQNIRVEETQTPISLVILVQANAGVEGLLPYVNKIGSLIGPQVIGNAGEAAVIAYDSRIRTLQDFTSDSTKVAQAIAKIQPGSTSSRMVDAIVAGTRMLRTRTRDRRRIMLLIGETRDLGSEAKTRETIRYVQLSNISFYSVNMSRLKATLTASPQPGRPDPMLPAMRPLPSGVPPTPTSVQQMYGTNAGRAEFLPLMIEIFRDVKAIFKSNPVELLTKGTGGTETVFGNQRDLESALTRIGEELHSQYTISYNPNNLDKFGFHEIKVYVMGRPEVDEVKTRLGYWLGAMP